MTPTERAELAGLRAELSAARAEIDRLQALALEQARLVTLGGVPKPSSTNWANRRVEIDPVHPDYLDLARRTP